MPAVIRSLLIGLVLVAQPSGGASAQPAAKPVPPAAAPAPAPARAPTATPAPLPASPTIPVAEIATRAAQVPNVIRALVAQIAPNAEIDTIRERLPEVRQQMDLELMGAETILRSLPTLDMIQTQQQLWHQRELRADSVAGPAHPPRDTLTERADPPRRDGNDLARRRGRPRVAARAPAPILAQVDGVLEAIQAAEGPLTTERTAVLDLQSLVAEQVARSENVQARFREAQQRAVGGILTRDAPPLWDAAGWVGAREAFSDRLTETIGGWGEIKSYLRDPSQGLPMHAGIFVVLLAVFWAARRSVRRQGDAGDHGPREVMAFDRPYAAALVVALLFASSPISVVPSALRSLFVVLALVPVLRLTRPAFDPRLVPSVYALADPLHARHRPADVRRRRGDRAGDPGRGDADRHRGAGVLADPG